MRLGTRDLATLVARREVESQMVDHQPVFVLHEHHKPRHHFDLRLEEGGVLRSWAVPRGLPDSPSDDRLAVEVDDHVLDHATYIDAEKSIADHGWWED
jgi:DNA ligase D-like protein (predicted 3'-phosphoesterase)